MNNHLQRLTRLTEILGRDRRYKLEAYLFVIESLNCELEHLRLNTPRKRCHLTARELLEGIRTLGWERYGRLAKDVFESWGVHSSADFGEIVFNLIEAGEFTKTDEDRKEDFVGVFDFDRDLVKAYPLGDASKN